MARSSGGRSAAQLGDRDRQPSDHGPGRDTAADPDADPVAVARKICLDQLTARPRSRAELERVLKRRLVPEDAAATVLDRLAEVGLVDDAAFAAAVVSSRAARGASARLVAQDLRERGVAADVITEAVAEIRPEDEERAARALAESKARTVRGLPREVQIRRIAGALARRGYPSGLVMRVAREVADAEGGTWEDDHA